MKKREREKESEGGRGKGGQKGEKKEKAYIRKESIHDLVKYIRKSKNSLQAYRWPDSGITYHFPSIGHLGSRWTGMTKVMVCLGFSLDPNVFPTYVPQFKFYSLLPSIMYAYYLLGTVLHTSLFMQDLILF